MKPATHANDQINQARYHKYVPIQRRQDVGSASLGIHFSTSLFGIVYRPIYFILRQCEDDLSRESAVGVSRTKFLFFGQYVLVFSFVNIFYIIFGITSPVSSIYFILYRILLSNMELYSYAHEHLA